MEGVLRPPAMSGGIGQRADHLQELQRGARPAMRHDQRHGVRMGRADVGELDVDAVDRGDELRQRVQLRLGLAPVVVRAPGADEVLQLRELDALRLIRDGLPVRPPGRGDAATKIDERRVRHVDAERADGRVLRGDADRGGSGDRLSEGGTAVQCESECGSGDGGRQQRMAARDEREGRHDRSPWWSGTRRR